MIEFEILKFDFLFRKCDICLPGYWDLTVDGCKPCQCDRFGTVRDLSNTGLSCDAQTGRCYCIEGVRGERCDQCEEYYTIVEGLLFEEINLKIYKECLFKVVVVFHVINQILFLKVGVLVN